MTQTEAKRQAFYWKVKISQRRLQVLSKRWKYIELLKQGEKTVTDIYISLRIEQSVASQHLAELRKANLVISRKIGVHVYYSLAEDNLAKIATAINKFFEK
jgi:DNA-binding transcriptional ArsR family regulator